MHFECDSAGKVAHLQTYFVSLIGLLVVVPSVVVFFVKKFLQAKPAEIFFNISQKLNFVNFFSGTE